MAGEDVPTDVPGSAGASPFDTGHAQQHLSTLDELTDDVLIMRVRKGMIPAYGPLYRRHLSSAKRLARQLTNSDIEADDLVSEAFIKVLDALCAGNGPRSSFRAYLNTVIRHLQTDKIRRDHHVDLCADMAAPRGAIVDALAVPFVDTLVAGLDRTLAVQAFSALPERWQAVLWHTEIEQQRPVELARRYGLTANSISGLAYRARRRLRNEFLQLHLRDPVDGTGCQLVRGRLGAWTRKQLSRRQAARVRTHLYQCKDCRDNAAELAETNSTLPR